MKILAISGGTKDGRNDAMAREALMGAKEAGAEIEFIRLFDLTLKPCTACTACTVGSLMKGGDGKCILDDDYNWLHEKVLSSDGIIWVMPIFCKGLPAILHTLHDRMGGPPCDIGMNTIAQKVAQETGKPGPDPRKFEKRFTSFICMGGSEWTTRVSSIMNTFAMVPMWQVIDDLVFGWSLSIVMEDEKVAQCHKVGYNIAKAAGDKENAKYLGDEGVCPNCHSRNFFFHSDGIAECEVCGAKGELRFQNGKYVFSFPDEQYEHVHNRVPGKMKHMDDIGRETAKSQQLMSTPEYKKRIENYKSFISAVKP